MAAPDPHGNVFANRLYDDHTGSTFRAVVDLAELVRLSSPEEPITTWDVAVTTTALGDVSTHRFEQALSTAAPSSTGPSSSTVPS